MFDQAHVVLFSEIVQREHRPKDRCRFRTDEDRSMDSPRENCPISRHHQQIQGMFVHLAGGCWEGMERTKDFGDIGSWGRCLNPERASTTLPS